MERRASMPVPIAATVSRKTGEIRFEYPDDFGPGDADDQDGSKRVALYFTVDELAALLPILQKASEQIIEKVGRG